MDEQSVSIYFQKERITETPSASSDDRVVQQISETTVRWFIPTSSTYAFGSNLENIPNEDEENSISEPFSNSAGPSWGSYPFSSTNRASSNVYSKQDGQNFSFNNFSMIK